MRRTKIISTLGPRTRAPAALRDVISAGTDVVRLNFAHDTFDSHGDAAAAARAEATRADRIIGVLADLPGPKMRTGPVRGGEIRLEAGSEFVLTGRDVDGDDRRVSTTVPELPKMVAAGDRIFLADGEIVLAVQSADGDDVHAEVERGGVLRSGKGMHLPGKDHDLDSYTEDDAKALDFALGIGADYIGLSFVRDGADVRRARQAVSSAKHPPLLVAKIETATALDNLDKIIDEADALMVARGDLGIQTPLRRIPLLQKQIIHACNDAGKPVITATEMLESMTHEPLPTRAEVTDVANAVVDGTDALMLSEETAVGDDPAAAVRTMAEIAEVAESWPSDHVPPSRGNGSSVAWAVADSAVSAARDLDAAAIVCPAHTGATAMRVAAFRPPMPVAALCGEDAVLSRLALVWGVAPAHSRHLVAADAVEGLARVVAIACDTGVVERGQRVVVVAGSDAAAGRVDSIHVLTA